MWARLDQEQQLAKQVHEERRAVHCPEWLNAILRPTGAKGVNADAKVTHFANEK
jgi:hypothetical protein